MRDIKFRAWDQTSGKMFRVFRLTLHGKGAQGGWTQINMRNERPEKPDVLMQFAGLQDSNGTDVYEGDVLRINRHRSQEAAFIASVEFEAGIFRDSRFRLPLADALATEVIGNIYENPTLLTG